MTEAQWPENDMRQRIATLEAENTLVKEDFDRLQREKKHIAIELAALKGMLRLTWELYRGTGQDTIPWEYEEFVSNLRARAEEGSGDD